MKICQRYHGTGFLSNRYYNPKEVGGFDVYRSSDFPNVFLGGQHDQDRVEELAGQICQTFDCRDLPEIQGKTSYWTQQQYLSVKTRFDKKVNKLINTITSNKNCPVFVHCALGANRSVAVLAAALCELTGKSVNSILGEMRSQRALVSPQDPYYLMALERSTGDNESFKNTAFQELDIDSDYNNQQQVAVAI